MYKYHVCAASYGYKARIVASYGNFIEARAHAEKEYLASPLDTLVEVTHAGMVVWGPFVVGCKYRPMGVKCGS